MHTHIFDQNSQLVIATTVNLLIYGLPEAKRGPPVRKKGKLKATLLPELEHLRTVELPALPSDVAGSTFRAARLAHL